MEMSPLTGLGVDLYVGAINIPPLRGYSNGLRLPTAICLLPTDSSNL